ncbi:hypothetical protein Mapa_001158 [Marchantia paleacea]|nr:hypothetical protein Mapa_001158 [Marchantia paleacea]
MFDRTMEPTMVSRYTVRMNAHVEKKGFSTEGRGKIIRKEEARVQTLGGSVHT